MNYQAGAKAGYCLRRRTVFKAAGAASVATASFFGFGTSNAQEALRIILPFAAGGGVDAIARRFATALPQHLKQPVIVENRPGAGGAIASNYVKQLRADPNALLFTTASFVSAPLLNPGANYDPVTDFEPVSGLFDSFGFLIVNSRIPASTVREFVDYARSLPTPLAVGTTGPSGSSHVASLYLAKLAKFEILPVPYKGGSELELAVISGDVGLVLSTLSPTLLAQAKSGNIKVIGISASRRTEGFAGIEPIADVVPGFGVNGFGGVYAPLGVPAQRIQELSRAMKEAVADQEIKQMLRTLLNIEHHYPPAEFRKLTQDTYASYQLMVAAVGTPRTS